jgi:hypothetical protein
VGDLSFEISGEYLESCNCEAICPCRMIDGVRGGRSTYGVCHGVLTWRVARGHVAGADVSGLAVALVYSYDDDEQGSPWRLVLHIDDRADEVQRAGLRHVFLEGLTHLPWIRKARHVVDVRSSAIEIDSGLARVGSQVTLRATTPVETGSRVACIVPGYDRPGRELYADELTVEDEPFRFELHGNCAYASTFTYASG